MRSSIATAPSGTWPRREPPAWPARSCPICWSRKPAPLAKICRAADFNLIQLVTPTTSRERALRIAETSTGFIYYVSVTGITGERTELPPELIENVAWLRSRPTLPICIGFGISRPEHVRQLAPVADGLIVGSAIVRRIAATEGKIARGRDRGRGPIRQHAARGLEPDPASARRRRKAERSAVPGSGRSQSTHARAFDSF